MDAFKDMAKLYNKGAFKTDAEYLGQRRSPEWPFINLFDWACPFLHLKIGIGNDIMNNFMDWIDREVIKISPAEIEARNSLVVTEGAIEEKNTERAMIEASINELKVELRDSILTTQEKKEKKAAKASLTARVKEIKKEVTELKKVARSKKRTIKRHRSKRKYDDQSTENKINKFLAGHGIKREDYFARAFNGVNIGYIMKATESLFEEIVPTLKADNKGDLTDANIEDVCQQYKNILDASDAALSGLHEEFPSEPQLIKTEKAIQNAVTLAYNLGLSITPKWHIFSVHIFTQHERLVKEGWGGIFILDESYIEKSHQRMLALRRRMRGLRTCKKQQTAAAKIEHASNNPIVESHLDVHRPKKKRKGAGLAALAAAAKKQALEVKREGASIMTVEMNTGDENNDDEITDGGGVV